MLVDDAIAFTTAIQNLAELLLQIAQRRPARGQRAAITPKAQITMAVAASPRDEQAPSVIELRRQRRLLHGQIGIAPEVACAGGGSRIHMIQIRSGQSALLVIGPVAGHVLPVVAAAVVGIDRRADALSREPFIGLLDRPPVVSASAEVPAPSHRMV